MRLSGMGKLTVIFMAIRATENKRLVLQNALHWYAALCVCVCVCAYVSHSVVSDSLQAHGLQPSRLLCPWNSPGKNTGVGCHSLLQGIFPTQGLISGLLNCRTILYHLSHQGSPEYCFMVYKVLLYPFPMALTETLF